MIVSNVKFEYIVFCFESCVVCYNDMILVLSVCSEDGKKLVDLVVFKVVFYFYFQEGWNV